MQNTVAIIGGGPIGLAAAAHAVERGLRPAVFEAGPRAGEAIRAWQHVGMFSSWKLNIDQAACRLLQRGGWQPPNPEDYPSGLEFCERYLEPLSQLPALRSRILLRTRVTAVTRVDRDKLADRERSSSPFNIAFETVDGREGRLAAAAVIDCSGNWEQPRPAGVGGIPALGELQASKRLHYRPVDVLGSARTLLAGKTVAVLGNRHSAICTLIDLARLAVDEPNTKPIWLVRGDAPRNGLPENIPSQLRPLEKMMGDIHQLTAAGKVELLTDFSLESVDAGERLKLQATNGRLLSVDELIIATGFRPNFDFLRELRLDLHPRLECPSAIAPLIDPAVHTARTVRPHGFNELGHPDRGFFLSGIKSYGRAATFLLIAGYEQVRSIVAHLAGDDDAASRVGLSLPW